MDVGIDGGGARVCGNFKTYLWSGLTNCPEIDQEEVPDILSDGHHDFERHCKRAFSSPGTSYTVAIGGRRMKVSALQVTKGILTLHGYDITLQAACSGTTTSQFS